MGILRKVANSPGGPTRGHLESLYINNVCDKISPSALSLMRKQELKRMVSLALFYHNKQKFKFKSQTSIVRSICNILKMSESAFYKYKKMYEADMDGEECDEKLFLIRGSNK